MVHKLLKEIGIDGDGVGTNHCDLMYLLCCLEAAAKAHWEKVSEKIEAMMNQSAMLRGLLSEMLSEDKD